MRVPGDGELPVPASEYTVEGRHVVRDGVKVGGFGSNAAAWAWVDEQDGRARADADAYDRIGEAFAKPR
jgi:hypothetical protein